MEPIDVEMIRFAETLFENDFVEFEAVVEDRNTKQFGEFCEKYLGNYANKGKTWCLKGKPVKVRTHDFPDKELGKAIPYGIYDLVDNDGFVNVGIDHDTAQFAVNSIRWWWWHVGIKKYPNAKSIYITADGGGSNGSRCKLCRKLFLGELQELSNETGLNIQVSHYPPGTSKWNKIEHFLFNHISSNWRGRSRRFFQQHRQGFHFG